MRKSIMRIILISFVLFYIVGCGSTDIKDTKVSFVSSKKYDVFKNDYIAIIPFGRARIIAKNDAVCTMIPQKRTACKGPPREEFLQLSYHSSLAIGQLHY